MRHIRQNPRGKQYVIYNTAPGDLHGEKGSTIATDGKKIEVTHSIEKIDRAWFEWTAGGKFIQDAFNFLTPDEREFLMTGMTPEEWAKLFPPDAEEEETE